MFALAAPLVAASCAARSAFVPPAGAGTPAPDAPAAWASVAARCRALTSYRAEFGLTGRVGERRIRGLASARLLTAVTARGEIGLEATVSGQLVFRLGGTSERAVLLLRNPDRVVEAAPADILDALIGLRVGPARLLPVFGGCVSTDSQVTRAAAHGRMLEVVTADARLFLQPGQDGWQVRAGFADELAVDYGRHEGGVPRALSIRSRQPAGPPAEIHLDVRQVLLNTDVPAAAFDVNVPQGAEQMSIDELRASGAVMDDDGAADR